MVQFSNGQALAIAIVPTIWKLVQLIGRPDHLQPNLFPLSGFQIPTVPYILGKKLSCEAIKIIDFFDVWSRKDEIHPYIPVPEIYK